MRRIVSLSIVLLLLCFATSAAAQEAAAAPGVDRPSQSASAQPSQSVSTQSPQIVQLELWVVRLSPKANDELMENAALPLKDRKAVLARIRELEKQGWVEHTQYMMASALDDQQFQLQIEAREPHIAGMRVTQSGPMSSIQYNNMGVRLEARASVVSPTVVVSELQYEESCLQPTDVTMFIDQDGEKSNADRVRTFVQHAKVGCPNGGAVVVTASGGDSSTAQPAVLMFLACRVME